LLKPYWKGHRYYRTQLGIRDHTCRDYTGILLFMLKIPCGSIATCWSSARTVIRDWLLRGLQRSARHLRSLCTPLWIGEVIFCYTNGYVLQNLLSIKRHNCGLDTGKWCVVGQSHLDEWWEDYLSKLVYDDTENSEVLSCHFAFHLPVDFCPKANQIKSNKNTEPRLPLTGGLLSTNPAHPCELAQKRCVI